MDTQNTVKNILINKFSFNNVNANFLAFIITEQITQKDMVNIESFIDINTKLYGEYGFNLPCSIADFTFRFWREMESAGLLSYQDIKHAEVEKRVAKALETPENNKEEFKRENLEKPTRIFDAFTELCKAKGRILYKDSGAKETHGFVSMKLKDKEKLTKSERLNKKIIESFEDKEWAKKSQEIILNNWLKNPNAGTRDINILNYTLHTIDGSNRLLEDADIKLVKGMKYGLVGLNGVGKTTLLKRISRYDIAAIPKTTKILHVEQEIRGDETTVMEYVLNSDPIRKYLFKRKAQLIEKIDDKKCNTLDDIETELASIEEKINDFSLHESDAKAGRILHGLGFTHKMQNVKTKNLSGGWRMRVSLASALFVAPDLLLLDEPTNHLDFPSVIWLQEYLKNYEKTVLIVSHDRHFLNNVITHVIHFYQKNLDYYKGDYTMFEKVFQDNLVNKQKVYETQQNQIKHIQEFIDKFRYNAKRASMVQSRIKTLQNMKRIQPITTDKKFTMTFPDVEKISGQLVVLDKVSFGYSTDKILLKNIDFVIDSDSRIGLMGANGVGKSTLLKIILGFYQPIKGKVQIEKKCRIAYFTQHHVDSLDLEKSALENVLKLFEDDMPKGVTNRTEYCRGRLGRFGITQDLSMRKIRYLSGGQKSRVAFCTLVWKNPHLLILDEPTNHLDMETIDSLIDAIRGYQGGLLIVSHDQYFLSKVARSYWALKNCSLRSFESLAAIKKFAIKQ